MVTYLKGKNKKSRRNFRKNKILTTKLKSFATFAINAKTSSSITLSLTGIGLVCGLTSSNKMI